MNIGRTDCIWLADSVCRILGNWRIAGHPEPSHACIKRVDGLCLSITETDKGGRNKLMVKVYFDFDASLNGLNKEYVSRQDDDTRSISCQTDPRSVASAIQSRLLPAAEQTYFRLKAKCEEKEHAAQHRRQVLADLAAAIGARVHADYDPSSQSYKDGEVTYKRGEFWLDMRCNHDGDAFALKGYCNFIPVDLMCRLIPVIEQWWAEQQ